jgi:hypothetical protein
VTFTKYFKQKTLSARGTSIAETIPNGMRSGKEITVYSGFRVDKKE